jgi:hypothetical protein
MRLKWGARPPRAQSAAPSRLILWRGIIEPFGIELRRDVRRERAPNRSRRRLRFPGKELNRSDLAL